MERVPDEEDETKERGEYSVSNSENDISLSLSSPSVQHFDFHNPPADFDPKFVLAALEAYTGCGAEKWDHAGGALNTYWTDWKRFRVDLASWRLAKTKVSAKSERYATEAKARPALLTCDDCGKETYRPKIGPSPDGSAQVCGPCWQKLADVAGVNNEKGRSARRAGIAAV